MAFSVERILSDARRLSSRLKEHDMAADSVMIRTQVLQGQIQAMKQFQESLNELNEIARHRPRSSLILGLAEENSRIRELQAENKELRQSLEEHQSALELIMTKYREQVQRLTRVSRMNQSLDRKVNDRSQELAEAKLEKISEMAAIMQKALELGNSAKNSDQELIDRLREENRSMRRMLNISSDLMLEQTTFSAMEDKNTQTEVSEGEGQGHLSSNEMAGSPSTNEMAESCRLSSVIAGDESLCSSSTDSLVTVLEHSPNSIRT